MGLWGGAVSQEQLPERVVLKGYRPVYLGNPVLDSATVLVVIVEQVEGVGGHSVQSVRVRILDERVIVDRHQSDVVEPALVGLVFDVADGVR